MAWIRVYDDHWINLDRIDRIEFKHYGIVEFIVDGKVVYSGQPGVGFEARLRRETNGVTRRAR